MRTVKEIDEQLQKEHSYMVQLYAQINAYEESMERLKKERKAAEENELEAFIDEWLMKTFGINGKAEARRGRFIVFDKYGNYVKTVTTGQGTEFHYVGDCDEEGTLENWLKKNKLYAHNASSFCCRNRQWYDKSLTEQLENLGWLFDKNGKLSKTQW